MAGLLKFLLIAILILWLVRMVARLVLPWAFRKVAGRMQAEAQRHYNQAAGKQQGHRAAPEGEIRIDYVPPEAKTPGRGKQAGDFVDFEEIK
jgi:hypothetical protein